MLETITFLTSVILLLIAVGFYQKKTNGVCTSTKRLDGKTVIVTGGTTGMGLESATDFAARGARVIIACPFPEEGTYARKVILDKTGNDGVVFKLLDLASLSSVRQFAADIIKTEDRLDILLNNAGVGIPKDIHTADEMNFIMQVNYFGHFLLTLLLLPLLKKTGKPSEPSRIINVSSFLHQIGNVNIDNLNRTGYWFKLQLYGTSKLCLVLFAHALTKRMKDYNVVINSVDPGAVGTRIFDSINKFCGTIVTFLFTNMFKTPREGAQTALHVALDSKAGEISGGFFKNCKLSRAINAAYDDELAESLWKESLRLVKYDEKSFRLV